MGRVQYPNWGYSNGVFLRKIKEPNEAHLKKIVLGP
jgi:hypothetical protein